VKPLQAAESADPLQALEDALAAALVPGMASQESPEPQASQVSGALLEDPFITGWKRARALGTGIQLSGALYICWLLVPSHMESMLVQV
jgi:hypothetical protein